MIKLGYFARAGSGLCTLQIDSTYHESPPAANTRLVGCIIMAAVDAATDAAAIIPVNISKGVFSGIG